jgi:serine O-acetyltransferase
MNDEFYKKIIDKPRLNQVIPPNAVIAEWALNIVYLLFPENVKDQDRCTSVAEIKKQALALQQELFNIINSGSGLSVEENHEIAASFFDQIPALYEVLTTDIQAIYDGDPAARHEFEVIRTYPGFYAICFYRIAHILFNFNVPFIPRILTEHAHSKTGIDIHPAAVIGEYFHIDHGTGIVIGETCKIGRYVKLYQGVTLGALSVRKNLAGIKRHPTVEDRVIIYSGATILGGDTVIGHDSTIGGNVWLTKSVAAHSTVYHTPMITVHEVSEK